MDSHQNWYWRFELCNFNKQKSSKQLLLGLSLIVVFPTPWFKILSLKLGNATFHFCLKMDHTNGFYLKILCFVDRAYLYNLVNKANSVHNLFLVYILYMFRATMCPSSGEIAVFMRHLVLVILCR